MKTTLMLRSALAALACLLLAAGPAHAATDPVYTVYACHLPDGTPAPVDGFTGSAGGDAVVENRCAQGGGLYIGLPDGPISATSQGTWEYHAPAGTSIAQAIVTREVRNIGGPGQPSHRFYAMASDRQNAESCGFSSSASCPPLAEVTIGGSATSFVLSALCHYDLNDCLGPTAGPGFVSMSQAVITLRDLSVPVLTAHPSGDLYDPGPVTGLRSVHVSTTDEGSGVFTAALVVDGQQHEARVLDTNGGSCAKPFTTATPCKGLALGSLSLDTTRLSDGQHTVSVIVYDATEVNSVESPSTTITVDNTSNAPDTAPVQGSAVLASGAPAPLQLRSHQVARKTIRRPFDRPTIIRGQLVDAGGVPVTGTTVAVFTALDTARSPERPAGTVVTDASGAFRAEIPPGPSRRVVLRADGSTWTVRLLVPAPLHLLASRTTLRNKQKLMLTAYLAGTTAPARSADVAFQVLIGHQWRTFATRPVDGEGRARIGHRFRVTYQRLTYRFRAVVVGRRTFPFTNATSPPVAVRVN